MKEKIKKQKNKKLKTDLSKEQFVKESSLKFPKAKSPFLESTVVISGLQNLIGTNLKAVNELSKSLSLAMSNKELLKNYNDVLSVQKSIFDQVNTLNKRIELETVSMRGFAVNVLAPVSAAIADIGLVTANVNQLSDLGKIDQSVLLSTQKLSSLCLNTIKMREEFILSGLQSIKNLESFNELVAKPVESLQMVTNGVSEMVRSFPAFPHTLDLPNLDTVRDRGSLTEDKLAECQEKLDSFLRKIDPQFVEFRLGCWDTFNAKGRDYIGQASSSMRRLVDHILRALAPNKKVQEAMGNKDKPTRRDRIYYITGYNEKQAEHLKRLARGLLSTYDNLPTWDHTPSKSDGFVHGAFIAIEGHLLSLLTEWGK